MKEGGQVATMISPPSSSRLDATMDISGNKAPDGKRGFGFNIPFSLNQLTLQQFLCVAVGVFGCYSASAYMQEKLYNVEGYAFGFYLTFIKFLVNIVLSFLHMQFIRLYFKNDNEDSLDFLSTSTLHTPLPSSPSLSTNSNHDSASAFASPNAIQKRQSKKPSQPFTTSDQQQEVRLYIPPSSQHQSSFPSGDEEHVNINLSNSHRTDDGRGLIKPKLTVPWYYYAVLSIFSVFSLGFSSSSLEYLSYPTKIVIKSSKIVVIMIVGIFIIRKRYALSEYLLVLCTLLGLAIFTVGDATASSSEDSSSFSMMWEILPSSVPESFGISFSKGVAILALSLLSEAVVVNYQKKLLESYRTSPVELLFYTSVYGSVLLFFIVTLFTSELSHALAFVAEHPECNWYAVLFSLFGYGGMFSVLTLLEDFSPMAVGLIIVSKTALTVISSFFLFPKPLTILHIVGGLLVFGSLFGHTSLKHKSK